MMRQWVVVVPMPLRYWMASSQDLTATVHTIIPYPLLSGLSRRRSIVLCLGPPCASPGLPRRAGCVEGTAARGEPLAGGGAAPVGALTGGGHKNAVVE